MPLSKTARSVVWLPRILFLAVATACLSLYLRYIASILTFPYQWEPTDGDHLNFAHRIAEGLPVYLPLKSGQVLDIYTPLYHTLIAVLGGPHAGMILARLIAFTAWLLIPIGILFFYRNKWGIFYALIAAIFVWIPPEKFMLIYMVQVSPDALMAFLFFATLLTAEKCAENATASWWMWSSIGILGCLCFLAKQQGIIAFAVAGIYLLIRRTQLKPLAWTACGFLLIFLVSSACLEMVNRGQYFYAIFIDLRHIMVVSRRLACHRLAVFLFKENLFFFIGICTSLGLVISNKIKLTIWHISFFLHIPFLLAILGNEGGGPNYLATFWITLVIIAIDTVWNCANYSYIPPRNIRLPFFFSQLLLLSLFCSEAFGMRTAYQDLNTVGRPSRQDALNTERYSKEVASLLAGKHDARILANRNIGVFVAHNENITDEGGATFQYAWAHPDRLDQNIILNAIDEKKYDFIITGIQKYPPNVEKALEKNYKVALSGQINLIFKNTGLQSVYVPK